MSPYSSHMYNNKVKSSCMMMIKPYSCRYKAYYNDDDDNNNSRPTNASSNDDINNNNTLPPLLVNLLNLWTFPFSTQFFIYVFFARSSSSSLPHLHHVTQNKCYPSTTHVTLCLYCTTDNDDVLKAYDLLFTALFYLLCASEYYYIVCECVLYLPLLFC